MFAINFLVTYTVYLGVLFSFVVVQCTKKELYTFCDIECPIRIFKFNSIFTVQLRDKSRMQHAKHTHVFCVNAFQKAHFETHFLLALFLLLFIPITLLCLTLFSGTKQVKFPRYYMNSVNLSSMKLVKSNHMKTAMQKY